MSREDQPGHCSNTAARTFGALLSLAVVAAFVLVSQRILPLPDGSFLFGLNLRAGPGGSSPVLTSRPPPPTSCNLSVTDPPNPFARSCVLLKDVCLDQGRIILFDKQHRPRHGNGAPVDLPKLAPDGRQKAFYLRYWNQTNADQKFGLPPVPVRVASRDEPRAYLAQPAFSTCTLPVLFYQHNSFNFAHTLRDNAALFFSALREAAGLAPHIKILLQTGGGLPVTPMNRLLWEPISNMTVESLADASVRLPDEQIGRPRRGWAPLPPTWEGTEQRCFSSMYVCLHDLSPATWQLHAYGQLLVRHYGGDSLVMGTPQVAPPGHPPDRLPPPVSILRLLGAVAPGSEAARSRRAGSGGGQLRSQAEVAVRVVFQKRGGTERQLANAAELVKACNAWRFTAPSGARVRGLCWEVELSSLQEGIAAAQQADVFVGAHGANIANAWLMRPGSSVVELTMHGFEEVKAHLNLARRNLADVATQVQFWKVLLCDERASWQPGHHERLAMREGRPPDPFAPKYRNLVVRWEALRTVLQQIVGVGGDMAAYRLLWEQGRWWWLSGANQTVHAGPNLDMTCRLARKTGLLSA